MLYLILTEVLCSIKLCKKKSSIFLLTHEFVDMSEKKEKIKIFTHLSISHFLQITLVQISYLNYILLIKFFSRILVEYFVVFFFFSGSKSISPISVLDV